MKNSRLSFNRKKPTRVFLKKNFILCNERMDYLSSFSFQAVLLESAIVLCSGLLNKFIPHKDERDQPINQWLQYIDPSLTLVMVIIIAIKAIPVIWSLGHILVEAVPSGINTRQLIKTIMKTIPQIRGVHSVHVWRFVLFVTSSTHFLLHLL